MNTLKKLKTITRNGLCALSVTIGTFALNKASAQNITSSTPWVWMSGDTMINQNGHYGVKGVPGVNNIPGGRKGSASWSDHQGNFWLFGGRSEATGIPATLFNDLWKFNPNTKEWTWVSGDTISFAGSAPGQGLISGTQGVPATTNQPAARDHANHWVDNNGNLWLHGGSAKNGIWYNDLWKYDPSANTWTWVRGNPIPTTNIQGNYGTLGVPAATNQPGSRQISGCWKDSNGNLWLFGGQGVTTTTTAGNGIADLWKYDVTNDRWTWMGGPNANPTPANVLASYGTQNIPATTNMPGGRAWPLTWTDEDTLYMMGGLGYAVNTTMGMLNDMWKYNIATGQWTWVNGLNGINSPGAFISQGIQGGGRQPRSRFSSTCWADKAGDFWLFGGTTALWQNTTLNDIWKYDKTANEWIWVKGDSMANIQPVYNVLQTPNPLNEVGSRGVEMSWREAGNNNVWVFAGHCMQGTSTVVNRNDLWKIETCAPLGNLSAISGPDTFCTSGDTLSFAVPNVPGAFIYNWTVPSGWTKIDTNATLNVIAGNNGGTITVQVLGQCGDSTSIQSHNIHLQPLNPSISISVVSGQATFAISGSYTSYQWYHNNSPIPGANAPTYSTTTFGTYSVEVTTTSGCIAMSNMENFTSTGIKDSESTYTRLYIFPNPVNENTFQLKSDDAGTFRIIDIHGRKMLTGKFKAGNNNINIEQLPSGIYIIDCNIEKRNSSYLTKILKLK